MKSKFIRRTILGLALVGLGQTSANAATPRLFTGVAGSSFYQDGQVRVYSDINYRGSSRTFDTGAYNANELGVGDNAISSIKVPAGYSLIIFSGRNFTGDRMTITHDISKLGDDWNDKISSLRVIRAGESDYDNSYNRNYGNNAYNRDYDNNRYGRNNRNNSYSRNDYSYLSNRSQVTLFENASYAGGRASLSPGYYKMNDLGIPNDALSSIYIPQGFRVTLYKEDNFRGQQMTLTRSSSALSGDWNDAVSSIYIQSNDQGAYNDSDPYRRSRPTDMLDNSDNAGQVTFYGNENYRGASISLNPGSYDAYALSRVGNDAISSIRVPQGYTVTVYADAGFSGERRVYTSDTGRLGDWNDRISSVTITKNVGGFRKKGYYGN